jgi:D-sedoheptulose 7-phosphate isomerase
MMGTREDLERYASELAGAIRGISFEILAEVADLLMACRERGGTIFVLGNGGSAATASHFACDLAKNTRGGGLDPFRAVALTDNVPLLTAWGNDTNYERVFAEQLHPLVRPDDVVVIISASGDSPNVLAAAEVARDVGATTVALTGRTGGLVGPMADVAVSVPSDSMDQVEDGHMMMCHSLCTAMRARMQVTLTGEPMPDWLTPLDKSRRRR